MRIRFLTAVAGRTHGRVWSYLCGEEWDLDDEIAQRFVDQRIAERVSTKARRRERAVNDFREIR